MPNTAANPAVLRLFPVERATVLAADRPEDAKQPLKRLKTPPQTH